MSVGCVAAFELEDGLHALEQYRYISGYFAPILVRAESSLLLASLRSAFVSKLRGDHIEYGYMCFSCFCSLVGIS
jgi:hypothetical protein